MARESFDRTSRKIALCGVMAALSVVFLMAGVIPLSTYCCPALAMLTLVPVLDECGPKPAMGVYIAVSVLGLLLVPELEVSLLYVFLGYYPVLRPVLQQLPGRLLPLLCKLAVFNAALLVVYGLTVFIFRLSAVVADLEGASGWFLLTLVALANITFLVFDLVIARLTKLYREKFKKYTKPRYGYR